MEQIIKAFAVLGFTEEQAVNQLQELNRLIEAKMLIAVVGDSAAGKSAGEIMAIYEERMQSEENQALALRTSKEVATAYIDAITQDIDQEKRSEFIDLFVSSFK